MRAMKEAEAVPNRKQGDNTVYILYNITCHVVCEQ
jgi:hypothetical protein